MASFRFVPLYKDGIELTLFKLLEHYNLENNIECLNNFVRFINSNNPKPLDLLLNYKDKYIRFLTEYISDEKIIEKYKYIISVNIENNEGELLYKKLFGVKSVD